MNSSTKENVSPNMIDDKVNLDDDKGKDSNASLLQVRTAYFRINSIDFVNAT